MQEQVETVKDFGELEEAETSEGNGENSADSGGDIKNELLKVYCAASERNESKTIWNKTLVKICRQHLSLIFENMEEAVKYLVGIKSQDPQRNFFWNVFSVQEILKAGEVVAE